MQQQSIYKAKWLVPISEIQNLSGALLLGRPAGASQLLWFCWEAGQQGDRSTQLAPARPAAPCIAPCRRQREPEDLHHPRAPVQPVAHGRVAGAEEEGHALRLTRHLRAHGGQAQVGLVGGGRGAGCGVAGRMQCRCCITGAPAGGPAAATPGLAPHRAPRSACSAPHRAAACSRRGAARAARARRRWTRACAGLRGQTRPPSPSTRARTCRRRRPGWRPAARRWRCRRPPCRHRPTRRRTDHQSHQPTHK